ncbi:ER membrane complex subunit 2 [Perkinsus olseni]|uniref:ER membrane protein complex subunit 2 n=1 Tax=Perkinsus olseni TaxID=32597 RepID=A0A7J6TQJ2_PEROL|nr:ER membrane complex subunit 2 [Perkinsus olseni]
MTDVAAVPISELLHDAEKGGCQAGISYLQQLRLRKMVDPHSVLCIGSQLLTKYSGKLGDEKWPVLEQVLLASLQAGADDWSAYCLKSLKKRFPKSHRVQRLVGQCNEARGDYDAAEEVYEGIMEEASDDMVTEKRKLAAKLGEVGVVGRRTTPFGTRPTYYMVVVLLQPTTAGGVEALSSDIANFQTDTEVWQQVAMAYAAQGQVQQAAYCFEEVLLAMPHSIYNILTYAELLASAGQTDDARKYYCLALEHDENHVRALWGLLTTIPPNADNKTEAKLRNLAVGRLRSIYNEQPASSTKTAMLKLLA